MLGIKWELRGADILSRDEAYIIVANHQSSLDILGKYFSKKKGPKEVREQILPSLQDRIGYSIVITS